MKCHIWFPLTCSLGLEIILISLEVELKLLDHRHGKFAEGNVHVKSQPVSSSSSLLPALVQLSHVITNAWGV